MRRNLSLQSFERFRSGTRLWSYLRTNGIFEHPLFFGNFCKSTNPSLRNRRSAREATSLTPEFPSAPRSFCPGRSGNRLELDAVAEIRLRWRSPLVPRGISADSFLIQLVEHSNSCEQWSSNEALTRKGSKH